jgi:hypothetical protein
MRMFPLFDCAAATAFERSDDDTARHSLRNRPDIYPCPIAFVRGQGVGRLTKGRRESASGSNGKMFRAAWAATQACVASWGAAETLGADFLRL